MPFPETERVIYRNSPLAEVSVELRFAPILRIDSEVPFLFQERIRADFPNYGIAQPAASLPPNTPPQIRQLISGFGAPAGPPQHVFDSENRTWKITLARESLELKTSAYVRWEEFRTRFMAVRSAFEDSYSPGYYFRFGLRYLNVIRRSSLGLDAGPWSELLNPYVGGGLAAPNIFGEFDTLATQLHCHLERENCFLTMKTGIAVAEPSKEKCFCLEGRFHIHDKRSEAVDVTNTLEFFNQSARRLFRWSITDRLHAELGPVRVD